MIELLRIRDFALVDELDLDLAAGFSVLTGETGAGKSILLQALGLLLGDRASRDAVRTGAREARVEGAFAPAGAARERVARLLEEAGVPWDAEEPLLIARLVGADGRSRALVNGALVPLALLGQVGGQLVEVSSQHQHQGLLREETHLGLLDAGLGPEGDRVLGAYGAAWEAFRGAEAEVGRLAALERDARERGEFLRFQVEEIRAARLEPGEDENLRAERELLVHAEKLREAYGQAEAELYSGAEAALDRLARATRAVEGARRRDPAAEAILTLLAEARGSLEEAALGVRARQGALDADPRRLEAVEERLEVLRKLERKHGAGASAVLARLSALERELWEIENRSLALEGAEGALAKAREGRVAAARALGAARAAAARELEARVGAELEALGLGRSAFRVELEADDPGPRGGETARFLLAPNPGEPPRPLARVASGGELSRVLLALKNALRDSGVETLVFDEVDAGIGGATADAVADRLASLAGGCQLLCITHLPQIASRARDHLRVEKEVVAGRTVTRVRRLGAAERVEELARMLGGRRITETAREHARELVGRNTA